MVGGEFRRYDVATKKALAGHHEWLSFEGGCTWYTWPLKKNLMMWMLRSITLFLSSCLDPWWLQLKTSHFVTIAWQVVFNSLCRFKQRSVWKAFDWCGGLDVEVHPLSICCVLVDASLQFSWRHQLGEVVCWISCQLCVRVGDRLNWKVSVQISVPPYESYCLNLYIPPSCNKGWIVSA